MKLNMNDIDHITKIVTNRFKMDTIYLMRSQTKSIDSKLKRLGIITFRDEIREVIRDSIRHATSVLMIKEDLDTGARRDINDKEALFGKALNKEYIFMTEWEGRDEEEKQEMWEALTEKYIKTFEKTLRNKLKRKFIDGT